MTVVPLNAGPLSESTTRSTTGRKQMRKTKECQSVRLVSLDGEPHILRCTREKYHEGKHQDGSLGLPTWEDERGQR